MGTTRVAYRISAERYLVKQALPSLAADESPGNIRNTNEGEPRVHMSTLYVCMTTRLRFRLCRVPAFQLRFHRATIRTVWACVSR